MGTSVSLQTATLAVEPGEVVTTELRVRNTGDVVDQFAFQPLGDAASWITVEPPTVRLFPATDEVVVVSIAPPRDPSSKPGVTSWAVKAVPQEDPEGAAVGEGTVDVGTFVELGAELQPVTGRGRLTGRFDVAIDNRGNVPMAVRLAGTDAEQSLGFEFDPAHVDTKPGAAHFTKLKIKPGAKIWRGQPKTHPFQVIVEPQVPTAPPPADDAAAEVAPDPDAPKPIVLNGNLLQEPIIPKWLLKALLLLLALLLALWILWKTLLKPQVESAAREIAIEEVAEVEEQIEELKPAVEEVAEQAETAQQTAEQAETKADAAQDVAAAAAEDGGGGGGVGNVLNETSVPHFVRLTTSGPADFTTQDDQTFAITDIILQNPTGAQGRVSVLVNGETVLESALENFRDLDFHFVAPYVVTEGQQLAIQTLCPADCEVAVSVSGFLTTVTGEG